MKVSSKHMDKDQELIWVEGQRFASCFAENHDKASNISANVFDVMFMEKE